LYIIIKEKIIYRECWVEWWYLVYTLTETMVFCALIPIQFSNGEKYMVGLNNNELYEDLEEKYATKTTGIILHSMTGFRRYLFYFLVLCGCIFTILGLLYLIC
jgi:hypothetical protein